MGALSRKEILLLIFVCLALLCWIFATAFIEPAVAGLMVVVLMLLSGVLEWSDITSNKPAWNTFVWFATLVTLAAGFSDVGFIAWLGKLGAQMLSGIGPVQATLALVLAFYLLHYLFASTTALLPAVLAIGAAIPGINMMVFCLLLVTSLGIMGIITP